MSFEENLIKLRKEKGLSQEQLAEKLDVSRQTIYKWETGQSYPEMDRLVMLSDLFKCSIDDLIKKEVNVNDISLREKYDNFYNAFSKYMALGVALIILGVAILVTLMGIIDNVTIPVIVFFLFLSTSLFLFISFGIRQDELKKEIPDDANYYTKEEVQKFIKKYTLGISSGVVLIMISVIVIVVLSEYVTSDDYWPVSIMLSIISGAVFLLVYFGLMYSKYKMENKPKKENKLVSKISSIIMLVAVIVYIYLGFVKGMWHPGWVVFPIAGVLCGIVSSVIGDKE